MAAILLGLGAYQSVVLHAENDERQRVLAAGIARSRVAGKPLLIVGRPKNARHFGGDPAYEDVCVDLDPAVLEECPYTGLVADIEQPLPYGYKHFGAACIMHVLEHVDHPVDALMQIDRVSDVIYIAYPKRYNPFNWLHPEHKWIIDIVDDEIYVTPK